MAELNNTPEVPFSKKPHRPWKAALLEQAIGKTNGNQPLPEVEQPLSPNVPMNNPGNLSANDQLKSVLQEKNNQKEQIIEKISDKSNSSLLVGGFFQPNNMNINATSKNGQKINRLINDLKSKEQEITSLTSNLKISEAVERAEQAELIRKTEEQARVSAEQRMKKAIEQVHIAASQLNVAIEKTQLAELAQKEEEKARRIAEGKISKLIEQFKILEHNLAQETEARKTAEEKAQISLNQTIQTELSRQEIEGEIKKIQQEYSQLLEKYNQTEITKHSEELAKNELQQQFNRYQEINEHDKHTLEKDLNNIKLENTQLLSTNDDLHNQIAGLEELARQQEQQLDNFNNKLLNMQNHQDKLKQIIETEQSLRKLAEQKSSSALAVAAKAELEKKEGEKQLRLIDERAKRAVAHASKTVMKFLDSPLEIEHQEKELDDKYLEGLLK
jgi:hypothetical protein